MQRAQGIASRSASASGTPIVPTPSPNQSALLPHNKDSPASTPAASPALSSVEKDNAPEGDEAKGAAKVLQMLEKAWAFVKKWSAVGGRKFVDWLDGEGAKREKELAATNAAEKSLLESSDSSEGSSKSKGKEKDAPNPKYKSIAHDSKEYTSMYGNI